MSKNIAKSFLCNLPSGTSVHPCRLICRDGTIMWKHALIYDGVLRLPAEKAHEQHIIKTAQRLEELNSWVSHGLEPWECFTVHAWYLPDAPEMSNGWSVYFKHKVHDTDSLYEQLSPHVMDHEILEKRHGYLFFRRC